MDQGSSTTQYTCPPFSVIPFVDLPSCNLQQVPNSGSPEKYHAPNCSPGCPLSSALSVTIKALGSATCVAATAIPFTTWSASRMNPFPTRCGHGWPASGPRMPTPEMPLYGFAFGPSVL